MHFREPTTWIRVSRKRPCPICGKPDWCSVSQDGAAAYCMRVESDKMVEGEMPGWIHRVNDSLVTPFIPTTAPRQERLTDEQMNAKWEPIARKLHKRGKSRLPHLAVALGVSTESLEALGVGYGELQGSWCWSFCERNAAGLTVGISRRLVDGGKRSAKGSRRGLTYADDWDARPGPILIVEGGSDVAACLTMGRAAIGRPSCVGTCGTGLAQLISRQGRNAYRDVIVIGERDRREVGGHPKGCPGCRLCWPGKTGAKEVTTTLKRQLPGHFGKIYWLLPAGAKDTRLWLQQQLIDPNDRLAALDAGLRFCGGLITRGLWSHAHEVCMVCGARNNLETHEIANGSARQKSLGIPATWLRLCHDCHQGSNGLHNKGVWPVARQLALKKWADPEYYDRVWVNLLRGRQSEAITEAEVTQHTEDKR